MVVSACKLCDANKRVLSGSDFLDDEIPWALCVRGFTGRYEGVIFRVPVKNCHVMDFTRRKNQHTNTVYL